LAVVIGAAVHGVAQAQVFPSKPIHLVVPFAPGGSSDVLARLLAKEIEPRVGQTILVENRAGAGGSVAAGYVAKAPADGHTILLVAAGHAGMSALYDKLPFDPVADFAPVIGLTTAPVVVAVNAQSRFKSLQDLVAAAKAEPGKLNCAGGGGGATVTNLAFELLKSELKLTITAVPYKGSAPALTALIGNEIDCDSDAAASVLPLVQSGRLRVLAVSTGKRIDLLPDTPTIAETVLPGFDVSIWTGVLAPKGTPTQVVDRLYREFNTAMALPQVQERLKAMASAPMGADSATFGRFLASETRRWGGVIKQLDLKP
jgi:tripartite-type tricarboxylate transporter receptor subunit TctC